MKTPAIQKIRIPLLLALVCCEIASIIVLRGQPGFQVFVAVSLAVIFLVPPLLWIQELWRRGVSFFLVALIALYLALSFANLLIERRTYSALASLSLIPCLILILLRKGRLRPSEFSEEHYRIRKAEDIRFFWVFVNIAGIVACFIYLAYHPDGKWANLPIPMAFLFLCGIVYCLFIMRTHSSNIDSSQHKLDEGGRQ